MATRNNGPRRDIEQVIDPLTSAVAEIRLIQPHAARKTYICPGCNQEIHPGVGHFVIVPLLDTHARRHWHRSCWNMRGSRQAGR